MITLVASTITKLIKADNTRLRYYRISSDSTTATRLGATNASLAQTTGGFTIFKGVDVTIVLKIGEELFAVSTGTPNLSIAESYNPHDALYLR